VLAGFLAKTNIVRLLSANDESEALVKIQQMQGVINRQLKDTDGRQLVTDGPTNTSPMSLRNSTLQTEQLSSRSTSTPTKTPPRELYARVGSAVFGSSKSRLARNLIKPVMTVRAQIREM